MSRPSRHYVLAAGGTGGHLIPAFALATELHQRGHRVALITDARGAEIPGRPDFLGAYVLPAGRLQGKNPLNWWRGLMAIRAGRAQARALYAELEPACVVGFGGYPAFPALSAAAGMKIPTVIHEQNAVLGRVNRLLAGRVDAIATAYAHVARLAGAHQAKAHLVGNPVRPEVLALRGEPFPAFAPDGLLRVLVTGGSQGARVLSEVVPDALAMLPPALATRLQVTQQARGPDIDAVRVRYASHDIPAELATYFEDMATRLADAHLFIGRSGASTIAELTAVGRPAILIPLPGATDDHQAANAREMAASGGARMMRQPAVTTIDVDRLPEHRRNAMMLAQSDGYQEMAKELCRQIRAIAQNPETLANAAHAAWNCGLPNATRDLADLVEAFGGAPLMDVIRVAEGRAKAGAPRGALA